MMTETFINETYGINGITRISLKKIIEVFSFPNEININFSNKKKSINIKFIYDGLEVYYMLYFFSENIEKPEYQTLYFDVKYVHLNDDSIKIGDEIKTVIPKIKKILKEYQKKSDFRYSEDKYTGRYLFDNKNIKLSMFIEENISISANETLIMRMLDNLLSNALKYAETEVTVCLARRNRIILEIADDGIGISDIEKKLIWDRFYKVDKSRTTTEDNSSGLGLSITKKIVELHDGKIAVLDNKPKGTRFVVNL